MLELYRSELRRFRNGAAIYAVVNLVLLALLQQLVDLPSAPLGIQLIMLVLYMLSGLGFALYQFGTYRKPGRWIWLLHRPVHRARILAALALVALTLAVLAVALPLFAVLAALERDTRHVIDLRHYLGAGFLALSALSAWLAGGYLMLQRSRWAFVVLLLPAVLTMHLASAFTVLGLSLACNALLLVLLYTVFQPSRHGGDGLTASVAGAVPLQLCFYAALVWSGSMLFQAGQMVAGVHPRTSDSVPRGSHAEAVRALQANAMRAVLEGSGDPRATAWQAGLARQYTPSGGLETRLRLVRQHTVRHAIATPGNAAIFDNSSSWDFSHDRMMYRGVNFRTRADQGWMGIHGEEGAFDTPPSVMPIRQNSGDVVNAHNIYQRSGTGKDLRRLLHVEGAEQFISGMVEMAGEKLVLTNRRLVILDQANARRAEVALPSPASNLEEVSAARVAEGMLVMMTYGYRLPDGVASAPQVVFLVDGAGHVEQVARSELTHDFPLLFEHKDWWVSPALHALVTLPALLIDNGTPPDHGASRFEPLLRARPAGVWAAAMAAALLSAAIAAWWLRRVRLTARARAAWCSACLVLGIPALLSLMVLQPRAPAQVRTARTLPAAVPV